MALNKAAVQNGLVTAPENNEFRATHDVRRKTAGDEKTRTRTRRIPPSMVFGISTRYTERDIKVHVWKESLSSDGQQLHKFQQSPLNSSQ